VEAVPGVPRGFRAPLRAEGVSNRRRPTRAAEEGVAIGQEVAIGLEVVGARHVDAPALKALQAMLEHRAVDLLQDVEAHSDLEVGRDADEVAVEGGVMELAEREAVGNDRLPQGMAVGEDVGGFQQLVMADSADGAALLIGAEHALAKAPLVQALRTTAVTYCRRAVSAAGPAAPATPRR